MACVGQLSHHNGPNVGNPRYTLVMKDRIKHHGLLECGCITEHEDDVEITITPCVDHQVGDEWLLENEDEKTDLLYLDPRNRSLVVRVLLAARVVAVLLLAILMIVGMILLLVYGDPDKWYDFRKAGL